MDPARIDAALYALASVGNLFLAMLVVARARRAPGALPIAMMSLALFLWDTGECMHRLAPGEPRWKYLGLCGSSMAPAFLTHFVVVFCRRWKGLGRWVAVLYGVTALFTLSTASALFGGPLQRFADSGLWNAAYLVVLFPFLMLSLAVVHRRRGEVTAPAERNALNFIAAGIAVGVVTGLLELLHVFYPRLPIVGHAGSLACTVILTIAILRHRLLESGTPLRRAALLFALAASAVGLNMWLYAQARPQAGPALLVIAVATLAIFAIYRLVLLDWYEESERRRRLALIGTMAAGVAHEIKNPLASIKGAAQLVLRDLDGRADAASPREYLTLLTGEVDRLNGVVEDFLAFARPREPRLQEVRIDAVADGVIRFQELALPAGVRIARELNGGDAPVLADPELLKQALLNVLRNAVEACGAGGTVTVRTRRQPAGRRALAVVEVQDTGPGIPEDDLERVFQPFYTTKSKGTGLGLAIAARIAEAHHGVVSAQNGPSGGARFTFQIPERPL